MKRAAVLLMIVALGAAAVYFSERRHVLTPVSPNAVVNVVADAQRDLSRLPARVTRISDSEEIRIGNELAEHYRNAVGALAPEEVALQAYVNEVGRRLARKARRQLPYRFHLVPSRNFVNAFALPGGHVCVGRGILDLMTSEDELACVLGHEIEHIDHYHCAERVQIEARLRKLSLGVVSELLQLPIAVWQAGYSKEQELEADREGTSLAVQASYSPYGTLRMCEAMARLHEEYVVRARSPRQELSRLAVESIQGYFRSHPLPAERIAQIKALIDQQGWQDRRDLRPFPAEYRANIPQ